MVERTEREIQELKDICEAIILADLVRRERNEVLGVTIYLGQNGHNYCRLNGYDEEIGYDSSEVDLLSAVKGSVHDWGIKKISKRLEELVNLTAMRGGIANDIFSTSQFIEMVVNKCDVTLDDESATSLLLKHDNLIRIEPGNLWIKPRAGMKIYRGADHA